MNRDKIDQWLERGIFGLVLGMLVLMPLAFGGYPQPATGIFLDPVLVDPIVIAEWLTLAMLVLWGARLALKPRPRLFWPPICWAVVAFAAYAVVRYFLADIEYVARQEVLCVFIYASVFLVIVNNLHRQEETEAIVLGLVFLGLALSFYGVFQFITNSNSVWHLTTPYIHRATGTYICSNHFAGFLEMIMPLALSMALLSRSSPTLRIFLGYSALAMLTAIAMSLSRGGWFSTAAGLLIVFGALLLNRRFRLPAVLCLVLLIGAGKFFVPRSFFIQTRAASVVTEKGKLDDSFRFMLWHPAYQMWRDHPWLGVGPSHFDYRFGLYRPAEVQADPDRVHNDYLNTLADWGIVGALLVAATLVLLAVSTRQAWRKLKLSNADFSRKTGSTKFAVLLGATAGLVAILCHSVVDFNMHLPANALIAVTLMALVTTHLRFATEAYWHGLGPAARLASVGAILAASCVLGYQAARHCAENLWLAQAGVQDNASPAQVEFLRDAARTEPANPATAYALGEALRKQSMAGSEDSEKLANTAISWFRKAVDLNRWDPHPRLGLGLSLDWLGKHAEAETEFMRAEALDPNNYFVIAHVGWHFVEAGDYAAARPWLERSRRLMYHNNPIAENYLELINRRLQEVATNELSAPLIISTH